MCHILYIHQCMYTVYMKSILCQECLLKQDEPSVSTDPTTLGVPTWWQGQLAQQSALALRIMNIYENAHSGIEQGKYARSGRDAICGISLCRVHEMKQRERWANSLIVWLLPSHCTPCPSKNACTHCTLRTYADRTSHPFIAPSKADATLRTKDANG